MKMIRKKLICLILALAMMTVSVPVGVFAAASDGSRDEVAKKYYETGKYKRYINFKPSYFTKSSFNDDYDLAELSAWTAYGSISFYDPGEDPHKTDPSKNAYQLECLLEDKGFDDVRANAYFSTEGIEDSISVAAGQMKIKQDGKDYTLICVIPRSVDYKLEWAGNFEIGDGDIHSGFKSARDETLRFLKQYIEENNITGDLKIWITGHSRGAAVANMTGGFLAGGGAEYLGDNVSVTPQDIYCYCFATPSLIKKGAEKSEELSVEGARGGRYASDTPGEAFVYTGEGTVDPQADVYNGIKNVSLEEDLVARVPLRQWGLTYYGTAQSAKGNASWADMMKHMAYVNERVLAEFSDGADPAGFSYYIFDIPSLALVKDKNKSGTMSQFLDERISSLNVLVQTNNDYTASGYQDALSSFGGVYGLLLTNNTDVLFGGQGIDTTKLIAPLVLTYLSYVTERIIDENAKAGRQLTENEALAVWVGDIANYMSGLKVPENPTADYLLHAFAECIAKNPDSKLANTVSEALAKGVNDTVRTGLLMFAPRGSDTSDAELMKNVLIACARGADKKSAAYYVPLMGFSKNKNVRKLVFSFASDLLKFYPELAEAVNEGKGTLTDIAAVLTPMLLKMVDLDGADASAMSLGDAADASLAKTLGDLLYPAAEKARDLYGANSPDYYDDSVRHIQGMIDNVTQLRRVITYLLMYNEGGYSMESSLSAVCTAAGNIKMLEPAHDSYSYTAWICAAAEKSRIKPEQKKPAAQAKAKAKPQNLTVKVSKKTLKYDKLKNKKKTVTVLEVSGAVNRLTFKKKSGGKYFKVNKKTGKITVRKGTPKGKYTIKIKITAAAGRQYIAASKTVKVKIRVR